MTPEELEAARHALGLSAAAKKAVKVGETAMNLNAAAFLMTIGFVVMTYVAISNGDAMKRCQENGNSFQTCFEAYNP